MRTSNPSVRPLGSIRSKRLTLPPSELYTQGSCIIQVGQLEPRQTMLPRCAENQSLLASKIRMDKPCFAKRFAFQAAWIQDAAFGAFQIRIC